MEWSERLNAAVAYIEDNLTGDIDTGAAAEKALCSPFHFQRMFYVVNGFTLGEYIRRRRLTLAATELSYTDGKVIDIALKYGYGSPDAFTRAFRQVHGITPQAAREPGVSLVAYPRVSFRISIRGGIDMDYRIIEKPAFDVVGKARKFTNANGQNLIDIPKFWDEVNGGEDGEDGETLFELNGGQLGPLTGGDGLGVCFDLNGAGDFMYAIAVEKIGDDVPAGCEVMRIPAATWAVVDITGPIPGALIAASRRIYAELLPATGYEHAGTPDFEVYFPGDSTSPDCHSQMWVPVVKKAK